MLPRLFALSITLTIEKFISLRDGVSRLTAKKELKLVSFLFLL